MAGNDLTQMPDSVRDLITNKAALSVNDDYASSQGKLMSQSEDLEVWGKSLSDGSVAAVYLNRGERAGKIGLGSAVLGIQAQVFEDLTTGADLGLGVESWLEIPPHDAIFIRAR
jgi:alpha-galactosidase